MSDFNGNFRVFSSPDIVRYYSRLSGLQPAEIYAFEKYVRRGVSILDIGVGGGRTTPHLAAKAIRYVGIDYVRAMVDNCTAAFPEHSFYCADAVNLCMFEDAIFDVVVFSYNGIDVISPREKRLKCLSEVFRVLAPGGLFIVSSHNSRVLFDIVRPSDNAGIIRRTWRLIRAAVKSIPVCVALLRSGAFYAGAGYYLHPSHGGIMGYCATPKLMELDACSVGFQPLEIVDAFNLGVPQYFTPWYYYILAKPAV
jgi:SAM-dependent methyltransferase